jgi:hypothetical protein
MIRFPRRLLDTRDRPWLAAVRPKGLIICAASEKKLSLRNDEGRKPSRREAYQQEKDRRWREEAQAAAVAADLEEMRKLREYLIFHAKAKVPTRALIDAIDDHAERLTGG